MITRSLLNVVPTMAQREILRWLFIAIVTASLVGCASMQDVVHHGFGFDFIDDSPDAELLDYRYGNSRNPAAKNSQGMLSQGKSKQQLETYGGMLRGDELYVKWLLRSTGEIHEDTVDLRKRLPTDIENCRIYFLVRGPQLYVYLITPQRRANNDPPNGPRATSYLRTVTLYPGQPN